MRLECYWQGTHSNTVCSLLIHTFTVKTFRNYYWRRQLIKNLYQTCDTSCLLLSYPIFIIGRISGPCRCEIPQCQLHKKYTGILYEIVLMVKRVINSAVTCCQPIAHFFIVKSRLKAYLAESGHSWLWTFATS